MESGTPAMALDLGYREEDVECLVNKTADEGKDSNRMGGRSLPERVALNTRNRLLRIGTWSVRTIYQAGKLNNALKEMEILNWTYWEFQNANGQTAEH